MDDRPSEALVEQMIPALGELAQLIAYGARPDSEALKSILARAGLAGDKTALDEMERWGQILQAVHDMPNDSNQTASAIAGLQGRGVRYAPATLAVEQAGGKPLTCEPDAADLGLLKPGELANGTLMNERPSEELVEKMMPALSELANRIGYGDKPDSGALKSILARAGLAGDKTALDEMERWGQILQAVHDMPNDSNQRAVAITALLERGVREAPATLAVERSVVEPITVEPDAVDFGLLSAGEAARTTLTVSGKLRDVKASSKRLSVALHRSGPTRTLVKIMITPGEPGKSLSDELVLRGEGAEKRVPVTARWGVIRKPAVPKDPQKPQPLGICLNPACPAGTQGEESLFWNWRDKKWGCLNRKCPDFCLTDGERRRP